MTEEDPLAGLARLAAARTALDRSERDLIAAARQRGASWSQIADALGLRSRQAAEQRWLRLSDPDGRDPAPVRVHRQRQRSVDKSAGAAITALRAATWSAHRQLEAQPDWDDLHPRAALLRASVAAAAAAEPGALFALVQLAIEDLDAITVRLPGSAVGPVLDRLRHAWVDAKPPH